MIAPNRRAVAGSLFFSGYAAASLSACANPVTTAPDALITEDVVIPGAGGYALPAYVARPDDRARHGAIIVVNEIFGIHDYIKDVCRRFARESYVADAPDYFDRAGDPAPLTDWDQIRAIVATATYEQTMGDTGGALEWLRGRPYFDGDAGITVSAGGSAVVWMACARFDALKAGVAWYGRLVGAETPAENDPDRPWPVDIAGLLHTPVLGLYAEQDRGIPVSTVEQMRAALQAADNPSGSEIIVYPGAGHGFHADYRESYNEAAATDGWARALAWFRQHGVA
ncbi:MAG: dienelactone hydrolase family protein [Hyphomonadaceae bacterium]